MVPYTPQAAAGHVHAAPRPPGARTRRRAEDNSFTHRRPETMVELLGARKKSHRRKDAPSRGRHGAPARSPIRDPWHEQRTASHGRSATSIGVDSTGILVETSFPRAHVNCLSKGI